MRSLVVIMSLVLLNSCASTSTKNVPYNFENDPRFSEEAKKEIRESNAIASIPFEKAEEQYKEVKLKPFYFLSQLVGHPLAEKNWDKLELYAGEYLKMASEFKDNFDYGNAIFYANIALSRVAFHKNHIQDANKYLIAASKTPGSPQLDSFGPFNRAETRSYLKELVKKGERKVAIEFASNCKSFISKLPSKKRSDEELRNSQRVIDINVKSIDDFINQIQKGETPDFKF